MPCKLFTEGPFLPGPAAAVPPQLGAALAYYTIFAIAPLFLIAMSVAGFCFGEEAAHKELFSQVYGLVGRDGGEAIQSLVAAANLGPRDWDYGQLLPRWRLWAWAPVPSLSSCKAP